MPTQPYDDVIEPPNIVEKVLDDEYLDNCIDAINNHAHDDASFQQTFGLLLKNEKHRALLRGFRAIKWHLGLLNIPQRQWAWSSDMLKRQPEIAKVLTFKQFKLLNKHFRVTSPAGLPPKDHPQYHPLQNILSGVETIKTKSQALWKPGWKMVIDEGRVRSKSKYNKVLCYWLKCNCCSMDRMYRI